MIERIQQLLYSRKELGYMVTSVTIVVADNQPIMRAGILGILQRTPDLRVIGEASDSIQAINMCRELHPDLLLLDIHPAKMQDLMTAHLLQNAHKTPRIILFSTTSNAAIVQAALEAGVSGYILKSATEKELLNAIYRVIHGQRVLLGVDKTQTTLYPALSIQELLTLRYVADGLSTKEIARHMSNSTRTIETYINRIFCKLGANNRTQAVAIAHREQLL
jgi:DNA-binding NarL/FixJ family response regulator